MEWDSEIDEPANQKRNGMDRKKTIYSVDVDARVVAGETVNLGVTTEVLAEVVAGA